MFFPPHCPNPKCVHYQSPKLRHWYSNIGHYSTITFGNVPRYRCRSCRKGFSRQTFSIDYYAKRRLNYTYIYNQINAGAGLRNIARDLEVREKAISIRINRMARSATLISQIFLNRLPFGEDLVLDGLQNFCLSQYFPDNSTVLVGKDSQFVYECDHATIRRGGRMRADQKIRRAELEKLFPVSPKSIERSVSRIFQMIIRRRGERPIPLILYTDEKSDYRRALWKGEDTSRMMFTGQWRHHTTSSKDGRNQKNPLFAVNYIDREIRKDMAGQARETVQFPRNAADAMLRMNLYLFDHNVRKPYRINGRERRRLRLIQVAGLEKAQLDDLTDGFYTKRWFRPLDLELSESARMTLGREWKTPLKKREEILRKHMAV